MLSAIKDLAVLTSEEKKIDPLSTLVENPKSGSYVHAFVIEIEMARDCARLEGVALEQLSEEKYLKYLYRPGSPRGADLSPSAKITEIDRTFQIKLLGWFRTVEDKSDKLRLTEDEREYLGILRDLLEKEQDKLINQIETKMQLLPKKENALLTITVNNKYPGEIDVFRKVFIGLENLKDEAIGETDKVCSICGKRREFVSGNISTYKFYTIDKPGFITGGFDNKLAWRNFPVCPQCKLDLEAGKKFIEANLQFRFVAGVNYYLIPRFLLGTKEVSRDVLELFLEGPKKISLAGRVVKRLTEDESEVLQLLSAEKDLLCVQFLFLKSQRGAERILLLIDDVYPSMLRKIFMAKEATEKTWGFLERPFTFGTLRTFFAKSDESKNQPDLDQYFLQLVEDVFRLRPVEKGFVLQFIINKIRHDFNNQLDSFHWSVLDGLLSLTFLLKLGLISFKEVGKLAESRFDELFKNLSPMLSSPAARGTFLLGALTEMLLNKQYTERGSKPFQKQLKGLRLTERDIRGLLPKVENKLLEYESFDKGKRKLAEEIAVNLLAAGENWKLSGDEINFYFAAGMNLAGKIGEFLYQKDEEAVLS